MNLAFFLKILTDLCYYGIFAAFFASFYGLTGSLLPQLALIALAAALSRALWQKEGDLYLRDEQNRLTPEYHEIYQMRTESEAGT